MINVTLKFNRRKNGTKRNAPNAKKAAVEIEYYDTITKKRRWRSTGISLYTDQCTNGVIHHTPEAARLMKQLQNLLNLAIEEADKAESIDTFSKTPANEIDFIEWMTDRIHERNDITEATRKHHMVTVRFIERYSNIRTMADLTPRNITLWDIELKKHTRMQTSVYNHHKRLKPYIKLAIRLGLLDKSPYENIDISRGRSRERQFLTEEQRQRIERLDLKGYLDKARDMFILSCYTGLAYCDLIRIKDCIVEEAGQRFVDGHRLKTQTRYKLLLLPPAEAILSKWNDDMHLLSNQKANDYLKVIASAADINIPLSMHIGRHTFATWALSRGIPIEIVSKMLAHTDIKTTQIYAKVLQTDVIKAFDKLK